MGAAADLAGPVRRSWARSIILGSPGGADSVPSTAGRHDVRAFLSLLGDELLPTAAASRRVGAQQERARLAADLHAHVLPDLRRAAAAADAAPNLPEPVAAGLRNALGDIEELMYARQSILLEEYGLVAALEWLAERTEERSAIRVSIEIEGQDAAAAESPTAPRPIERAAFRIALLAVDNAVRHSGATAVEIRVTSAETSLRLVITDNGRGFGAADGAYSAPRPAPGRGLRDMRAEAAAIGAAFAITSSDPGTTIDLRWPAARG